MHARNAAKVLPEPVGAEIRVVCPGENVRPALLLGLGRGAETTYKPLPHQGVGPVQGQDKDKDGKDIERILTGNWMFVKYSPLGSALPGRKRGEPFTAPPVCGGGSQINYLVVLAVSGAASTPVGKAIVKMAADSLKRVSLENWAENRQTYFLRTRISKLQSTAPCLAFSSIRAKSVPAGSRILVEKPIYTKFVEDDDAKAKKIRLGPPLERETKMGPLVSKEQFDRVSAYQEIGRRKRIEKPNCSD